MTSKSDLPKPSLVTGGCLCGGVRYRVDFPKDHDFETASFACHCTQCRRSTGSLFHCSCDVPDAAITWESTATRKIYSATPGVQRAFCSECGSFLYWRRETDEQTSLAVGCIDPEFLVGKGKDVGGGAEAEGFGMLLAKPTQHLWVENTIKGVTDKMPGKKWAKSQEDGIVLSDD